MAKQVLGLVEEDQRARSLLEQALSEPQRGQAFHAIWLAAVFVGLAN